MARLARFQRRNDLLSQLHQDFDRLLSNPLDFRFNVNLEEGAMGEWVPSIDVKEEDKQFVLHADVPGVKARDIDVHMENGLLTIKGKRETEHKKEKENFLCIERSSGAFIRQLSLPEGVDQDNIKAKCHDGVLEVILPKNSQSVGKKIKVEEE